jgi:peptidoglycan/xylan/chitin deacetylase (PgdA/CDA1 family)
MNLYQWIKRARARFERAPLVCMYHRIAPPDTDPWELSVSPQHFEQQLQVLKKTGLVVPALQVAEQLEAKKTLKPGIVLTFDDGYADNYLVAKPLLEKYELPATFFFCTEYVGKQKEFWWDELAHILLNSPALPDKLSLEIGTLPLAYDLQQECFLTQETAGKHKEWKAYLPPPTHRSGLYEKLWQLLSPLPDAQQQQVLRILRTWAGLPAEPRSGYVCMSKAQLLEMAGGDLFTIGAHTVTHPALSHHGEEKQRWEITQSRQFLEKLTVLKIDLFAYPSGIFNNKTQDILRQEGFRLAFTTEETPVKQQTDPYRIGRFQINNWSGKMHERFLSRWL